MSLAGATAVLSTGGTAIAAEAYPYQDPSFCPPQYPWRISATQCSDVSTAAPVQQAPRTGNTDNIATDNTYANSNTSLLASTLGGVFYDVSPRVYVPSGVNYPDAIAAGPLFGKSGSALFISDANGFAATQSTLQNMSAQHAVILGGPAAINNNMEKNLGDAGVTTERLAGADRYETAALIAKTAYPSATTVMIASGQNFPDALAAGPAASKAGIPILLTDPLNVPARTLVTLRELGATNVVIIGGVTAVSNNVVLQLQHNGQTSSRIAGADRYGTAIEVAKTYFPGATTAMLAPGVSTFQSALVASGPAAKVGAPLLLRTDTCTPAVVQNFLNNNGYSTVNSIAITSASATTNDAGVRQGC